MNRDELIRCTAKAPCPVCGKGDFCSLTADGMILCGRTRGAVPGFRCLGPCKANGDWHQYRRDDGHQLTAVARPNRAPSRPDPAIDRQGQAQQFAAGFTGPARAGLADALGLPVEALDALPGIGWNPRDKHGPCWTIPETDGAGRVIGIGRRYVKPIEGGDFDGKTKLAIGPRGLVAPPGWRDRPGPVLLVEGASDTIALTLCGLAAVGRPSNKAGVDHIAELLRDLDPDRPIVVVGENDQKPDGKWPGREGAEHTAAALAERLGRPVTWALCPEGFKDAREFVKDRAAGAADVVDWAAIGREFVALLEWIQTDEGPADERPSAPLPVVYFGDAAPAIDTADFVEGLLIDGALSVVYGDSNTGKTFFALDIAIHVAAGAPWRGREVERRGVLYLALEGVHGISNRIAAYRQANEVPGDLPFAFTHVPLDLCGSTADAARVIEAARAAAGRLGIPVGLVVVDTVSRALAGGNENDSEAMGALVRHVDLLRTALNAHVLLVHHSGKDATRGARGHSLLRAAVDTEIEVTRDPATGVSVARVTKQRELECAGEFAFRLESVTLGVNRRGKPVTSCVVREADPPAATGPGGLPSDQRVALSILEQLIGESGIPDYDDVPGGATSVPKQWWRERFYERAKPGANQEAKRKAFTRAVEGLIGAGLAGENGERVWLQRATPETCRKI